MKRAVLFLMMFLSGLFASAATYNVTIDDFDFDISNYDLNVDITSQIGDLLQTGDKVIVTVDGYFNYSVNVTLNCIADNSEAASYWKMLSNYETADLGSATVGTKFSESYEFTLTEDAVTTDKYIVQVAIGFSSILGKKQCQENGGIVTLRPTDEPDPEGETYTIDITSTVFSNDGNGSNYMAQFPFVTESTTLKKNDKVVVTLDGSFSQDMNGINFMIFDGNGNVVMAWTAKSLYAPANEPVKTSYEFNIKNTCSTETYQLGVFVEGYDENVILKFTTADDAQYVKVFSLPYNQYGARTDEDNISDQWSIQSSVEYTQDLKNAVYDATGNSSWSPSVGETFVVLMSGVANFSGTMKIRLVDTRDVVNYWGELTPSNLEEITVSEGEEFTIEEVLTIIKDTKNGESLISPQLYIECYPTLTSTMEGFDNTKIMKLYLSEYSVTYQPAPTYARVFETSYTEFSADRDEDGESDDWQGSFNQEFIDATGLSSYTPAFGDSFTFKMQGFANFTGEMAFYMVDNSSEAGYWLQFAEDVDIVQVIEGEEYSIERTMFVSRTKKDGYTLKNPHFIIMCYPNVTSSMYGFSTEDKKIFYATEYSMEYTPANFVKTLGLSYNSYGKDTDEDNISDEWQGKYPNEFLNAVVEANGNTAWKPSLGEKFTITMEGFTDFTGDLSLNMVDIREDVEYWAPFADYEDSFRVKKGTTFTIQRVIEVAYLDKLGIALQDPYFVIGCEADVTSTKSNFDEEQIKHLYLTKYSIEYEGASQNTDEYEYLGGPKSVHGSFYTADNGVQTKAQLGEDGSQVLFCLGSDDKGYYLVSGTKTLNEIVSNTAAETRFSVTTDGDDNDFNYASHKVYVTVGGTYGFKNKNAQGTVTVANIDASTDDVKVKVELEAGSGEDFSDELVYLGGPTSIHGSFFTADNGVQTKVQLGEDASKVVFCLYMMDDNPSVISGTESANEIVSSQASETKFAAMPNAKIETYNNLRAFNYTSTSIAITEGSVYAFTNNHVSGFFTVGNIDTETQDVSLLIYKEEGVVKVFETSYVDWSGSIDVDNDGVSDQWGENFDEFTPVAHTAGVENWQPSIGDKFTVRMAGVANFTGYVQLYMIDVREEVGWFKEFSTAPERFYVKNGERFDFEREFVVKTKEANNVSMIDPKLNIVCVGAPLSSHDDFDNTIKKTLSLIKYEMKYVPFVQELIATWDSYTSNDTDLDGISDLWNGNKNVFDHYNNIGDSYEFQMSGISDFTGTVKFWMINWGSNGQTWNEIAQNPSPTFNVTEGEEYNFTWTFSVTEDEWELGKGAATVLHYQFMPSTTSTKEGFDNSAEMKLFVNKYSQTYTPVETVQAGYSYLYNLYSDTLKIYLPDSEVLSSTYGSPITYEITSSNTSVPAYISNDTLYIKSIEDDRSKNIEIKLKGTIENGSSAMGTITVFAQDAYWEWRSVRANDTLALYVPNEYLFSRAHVIAEEITSYQVLYEETDVPLYFSNDTLYAMPTKDHIDKTIYVVIKGRCDNGSVIGEKLALYIEHDSIVPNPQIALVTVSETSGKNLVVWQKFDTDKIDHYNIYREGEVAGKYEKIAEVPYSEISVYEDLEADPIVQPWRYGITATPTDDRYSETEMISVHKTLHLQQNQGLGGVINLSWNEYKGVDYSTYKIIRKSVVRKEVIIDTIATVPSNLTTYTDIEPAKGTQAYYVAIELPQTIDPNVLLKSENGPFSLAISNIAEVESDPTAVANVIDEKVEIRVTGRVITILNAENGAKVYDVSGRFVAASDVAPVQQVEVAKAGVYFVKIGDNVFKVVLN